MSSSLDQEFETGVRLIRDAYSKKLSQKESEVVNLRGENARKDAEIKELEVKVVHLESQLGRADKRINELTRLVSKLSHFKQSVLDSFEEDDYSEVKKKLTEKSSRAMTPNLSIFGDYQSTTRAVDFDHLTTTNTAATKTYATNTKEDTYTSILKESMRKDNVYKSEYNNINEKPLVQEEPKKYSGYAHQHSGNTVDGRDYFKKAKSVLTYDEFTNLLWNVKAYNNREQTRLKTLENVYGVMGEKYKELYEEFEKLLSH